ncbi:YfcE family phosphodiesterase [Candidatus Falkowbacteria bacterium]|nr:YfcE family phosphodiesterase [Candidatus Falkowbacteria bacterium]
MKIAIISDIHDNVVNLEKCLKWCQSEGISTIVCCGDVTNAETVDFMASNFKGMIHLIMGNADNYDDAILNRYSNIKNYDRKGGKLFFGDTKVGFCHEPYHIKHLFHQAKFDIVFYGHTHKPWESDENGVRLINPGTLGGVFYKASFAVWDTETSELTLKILEEMHG